MKKSRGKNKQANGEKKIERSNKKNYGSLRDRHRVATPGTKRTNENNLANRQRRNEWGVEAKGDISPNTKSSCLPSRTCFLILGARSHAVGLSALQNWKRVATGAVSVNMRKRGEPGVEYAAGKIGLEWKQDTGYPTMMSRRIPLG